MNVGGDSLTERAIRDALDLVESGGEVSQETYEIIQRAVDQYESTATSSGLSKLQYAVIYDLISEGEIEGLVEGPASILLNGAPIVSREAYLRTAPQGGRNVSITGSGTGGTSTLTLSGDLRSGSESLNRHVLIEGAGKDPAAVQFTFNLNSPVVTTNSSWFVSSMEASIDDEIDMIQGTQLQIDVGNGQFYTPYISSVVSATEVITIGQSPVGGTFSGSDITINLATKTSTDLSSSTITLEDNLVSTVSNARVVLGSGVLSQSNSYTGADFTFDGTAANFMTGTLTQKHLSTSAHSSAASYLYSVETALKQHTDFGGDASSIIITPASMNIANAEDIDKFKVNIEGPSLISTSGNTGNEYAQAVEVQIIFKYVPEGGTPGVFNSNVVVGRTSPDANNLGGGNPSISGYWEQITKKPYIKEFRIDVEKFQPFSDWQLEIKKVSGDSGQVEQYQQTKDTSIKAVQAQVLDKLSYRGTSYATVSYSAKDFGNPPKRSYVVRGKKIRVPTNYITREENDGLRALYTRNVSTGVETGTEQDWDGNFRGDPSASDNHNRRLVYCNNPAWVFYDIIVNPTYGLGDYIDEDLIDIYSLYQIAQYCDGLVPDAFGGLEPRFTTNVIIESRQEAYKVLKDLATVFRGIMYWINGQVVAIQDSPKESVYTFTQGNVKDGLFTYEGQSDRVTKNRVNVSWRDPLKNYKQSVVTVDDIDSITQKSAILPDDIVAFGCTSRGQAYRAGKWYLETNARENEVIKFETGSNASFILPGDIISVQDHEKSFVQFSGRISKEQDNVGASPTPDANTIHLDREVTLAAGSSYVLHVYFKGGAAYLVQDADATVGGTNYSRGQLISNITSKEDAADATDDSGNRIQVYWTENGHIKSSEVDESSSSGNIIELVTGFSAIPDSDSIWALTTDAVNGGEDEDLVNKKQYRVLGIEETEEGEFSLIASLYDISKYTLIDFGYPSAPDPNIGDPVYISGYTPAPTEVGLQYIFKGSTGDGSSAQEDDSESLTISAIATWDIPVEEVPTEEVDATTTLTASLLKNSEATEIQVTSSASFKSSGVAAILSSSGSVREFIYYSGKASGKLTGVKRGYYTTPPSFHDSGATIEDREFDFVPYRFLSHFEIRINSGDIRKSFSSSVGYDNLAEGTYTVQVRSVSTKGVPSDWAVRDIALVSEKSILRAVKDRVSSFGSIDRIPQIDSSTGEVTISPAAFTIRNPSGNVAEIPSVISLDYSSLVDGEEAFVYYDYSEVSVSPPTSFKEAEVISDSSWYTSDLSAASSPFIYGFASWWSPLNDANNGLTTITGTITTTVNRSRIVGSGTSFLTDYSVGDLIRISSVNTPGSFTTDAWYSRIESVESDTVLYTKTSSTKAFTGAFGFKQSIAPQSNKDLLVSKVIATGSPPVYSIENLLSTNATDGLDAETVNLTASNYVAKYSNGSLIDSSPTNNITLTATPSAGLGSPTQYRFLNDAGSPVQDWSTDNDYVIPESGLPAENTSLTYKVEVTDGESPYSFEAFDTVTIAAISDGLDGSPGADGRPGLPGASRILPYDNLQSSLPNAAGQYAFLSGSTPTYVTSWADIKSAEVIQLRPFTDPLTTNQSQYYDQIQEGDVITYYITSGKWVDYVVDVNNGLIGSPGAYEFEVTALEFDETGGTADPSTADGVGVKFRFSRATEAISGIITNDTHAEAADSSGVLVNDLLDAGGNFLVFKGIQEVTNESPAPSFAVSSPSVVDGLEMTIDSAGVYSLNGSPSEWTGDAAVFELTATYEGFTVVKKYSIVKTKTGLDGQDAIVVDPSAATSDGGASDFKDRIVFTDNTTLEYFVWEDNTSIFKRATSTNAFTALDISLSARSQGSINVVAGDRITTNKPVSFLDDYTNVPSLAYAANIFTGKIYRAGYQFKLFRVFAPYQDADVEIWFGSTAEINDSPVTVSFTASYDTFTEQSYNNSGESSEGDARFVIRASAPVIVGFSQDTSSTTWTGGFDQQILVPPSNKVLMPNFSGANKQVSLLDPNGSSSTVNETSPIDASYTTSTDTLLHVSGIGDGDGTDSQHGIPTVWTADHYALPIDLDYYQVSAIEPCVVKVYQISNGALLDTFDFTNASETNIETGSRGTIAGSTIASNGAYFVGTGRFSVYGNPTSTGDELTPHGWYSKLRTVVENPPPATITGATLVDAQGNVIPDSVITNYEDSSTLKYNGQFTEFQTNGFPVGWDDIDGVYGTSTGVWSQHTGTNPDPLSGSSCLKYDYNGTSPASSYIVRQPSDKYAVFPEPPKVNLTVAGNAVVVGSIDVYIESGFSQPGNPPQLLMDLVTAYNSPVEYFRRFVTADSSITDEWQRLYFITSQETSTANGGATVGDPIIDIRAVIYPNNFQGVVFWDNLRFSILDPSVDNEQQIWQDIKGTYGSGVNMCIPGWDSASSAEFISANIGVTDGSGAFSTAQGKFDGTSVLITATSGAPCIVYAADNASDYNMPLQPSTSYIVSVYVRPSVQPATDFTVGIRQDNGTVKESADLRTDLVANQWTRVHALITTDSGVTSQGNIRILGDHSSSFTFYLDGLMVEEYLGGSPFSTGPSQFVKSGTFGATSGINLKDSQNNVITDDQIIFSDEAAALAFNPGFLSWSGGQLLGYDYTNADSITQFSGTSPTSPLIGGSMAYFNSTNTVNNSLRRVHGGDSPAIPMNFSTDSVVIGSLDVFINSFTTGTAPGIEVSLLETSTIMGDGSNSGYRAVVPFDTSATGKWQRVYFKVSKASVGNLSATLGSPTGTADFKTIRLVIGSIVKSDTGRGAMGQNTSQYYIDNLKLNAVDPSLENDQQLWADISGAGLPEDNATVGAQTNKNITNEVLVEEDFADFNLTRVLQTWDEPTGATSGEISVISTSVAKNYGGYALRVGNNSGNDEYRLVVDRARAMPLEFNQLYKITFVAKTTSTGSPPALAFLGLQGWKGNVRNGGGTSVTSTGGTGIGTIGHYIAARNSELTTDFQEYTAYFKRNINTGSVSASNGENLYNSPLNPWFIHTDAEFVSPLMILNFSLRAGLTEVSYVKLEKVEPPSVSEQPTDGGALLINPNFNIPNAENIDRPAGWWSGTTTTQPEYDDKSTSELLGSSDTVVSNAFKVDTDKKYRVTARIKSSSGGGSTVSINVNEYNSDLDVAGGKYAIGGSFNTDPIQQRNQNKALSPAVTTEALTTTYEIITGLYTPTSTTKWASLNFYDDATSAFILDWVTIEVDQKVSSSSGASITFNIDGSGGGTNFQPDVRGEYKYTFTASTSQLGTNGNALEGSNPNTPWQRHRIYFYRGENEIADFEFISLFNYITSSGGRSNNQTARTLWRSASYATGYSDSDFTVQIDGTTKTRWSTTSVTYGAAAHEYWNSTMYDGNNGQYTVRITHTESGHIHDQLVYVTPIVNGLDGEAPKA